MVTCKRRIEEIPRMAQFQARQAVLAATPKQAGGAERAVRQLMPYDVIEPEPPKDFTLPCRGRVAS